MDQPPEFVHKIVIVTSVETYNGNTLPLKLSFIRKEPVNFILNKVKTDGVNNIYCLHCNFMHEYVQFKVNNNNGSGGSVNEDDVNYNHCYDLYNDELTQTQEHETSHSVYFWYFNKTMNQNAITLYVLQPGG